MLNIHEIEMKNSLCVEAILGFNKTSRSTWPTA